MSENFYLKARLKVLLETTNFATNTIYRMNPITKILDHVQVSIQRDLVIQLEKHVFCKDMRCIHAWVRISPSSKTFDASIIFAKPTLFVPVSINEQPEHQKCGHPLPSNVNVGNAQEKNHPQDFVLHWAIPKRQ